MNFAERAFRYLFRKKGKAIILFWVLLITETMILSTVTILRASEVARIELLGKSKAKLLIEREKAEELFTDDEYKKLEKIIKNLVYIFVDKRVWLCYTTTCLAARKG